MMSPAREWTGCRGTSGEEEQLLGATAQGRCNFTFNVRDFLALAQVYPQHAGIILAFQGGWTISELIEALDRLPSGTKAEEWRVRVRWLNEWRQPSWTGRMRSGIATTTARPRMAVGTFAEYSIMAKVGALPNETRYAAGAAHDCCAEAIGRRAIAEAGSNATGVAR